MESPFNFGIGFVHKWTLHKRRKSPGSIDVNISKAIKMIKRSKNKRKVLNQFLRINSILDKYFVPDNDTTQLASTWVL